MSILIFLLLAVVACKAELFDVPFIFRGSRLENILKGLNDPSKDENVKLELLRELDDDSSIPALKASAHIYFVSDNLMLELSIFSVWTRMDCSELRKSFKKVS